VEVRPRCTDIIKSGKARALSHVLERHALVWSWACLKCGKLQRSKAYNLRRHFMSCRHCPKCTLKVRGEYTGHVAACRMCRACGEEVDASLDYDDHVAECMA
jgi:hypothetical protein